MNTTENNKIIADFLNYPQTEINYYYRELSERAFRTGDLKFHSDWNWLMEVIEKIESLGFKVNIFGFNADLKTHYTIIYNSENGTISVINEQGLIKIQAVYNACLEFIKWYNENGAKEN